MMEFLMDYQEIEGRDTLLPLLYTVLVKKCWESLSLLDSKLLLV